MVQDVIPAMIDPRAIRTSGHANDDHSAIAFSTECKNELSTVDCESTDERASYMGTSFAGGTSSKHSKHFLTRWRAPALGVVLIDDQWVIMISAFT